MPGDNSPMTHIAGVFLLFVAAAITIFDIYVYVRYGPDHTISYTVLQASLSNPIVPFTLGMLAGHLFWKQ